MCCERYNTNSHSTHVSSTFLKLFLSCVQLQPDYSQTNQTIALCYWRGEFPGKHFPNSINFTFLLFCFFPFAPHPSHLPALCPAWLARLQLIDDEGNLPRTDALLKTGRHVLSVGLGWEWITKSRAPWCSPAALLMLFFIVSSSLRSLKSPLNLLARVSSDCFFSLLSPLSSSAVVTYCI